MHSKPVIFVVGADKGGVGKTTVTRPFWISSTRTASATEPSIRRMRSPKACGSASSRSAPRS